jgi:hypothetical protein
VATEVRIETPGDRHSADVAANNPQFERRRREIL